MNRLPAGCGPLEGVSRTMQRNPEVWRGTSTFLLVVGQALVGSIFLSPYGLACVASAGTITTLLGGCDAGAVTRVAARQMADVLVPLMAVCVFVPGAQVMLPILGALLGLAEVIARGGVPSVGDVGRLGVAAADADGRVSPSTSRATAHAAAEALDSGANRNGKRPPTATTVARDSTMKWVIVYTNANDAIVKVAGYQQLFSSAIEATTKAGGNPRDWGTIVLLYARKNRREVAKQLVKLAKGRHIRGEEREQAKKTEAYLDALIANKSERPWTAQMALAIVANPGAQLSRPPAPPVVRTTPKKSSGGGALAFGAIGLAVLAAVK